MKKIKYLFLILTVIVSLSIGTLAYGLYNIDSFYSARCWTYTYSAPYTNSYNCLGFATGAMYWEWPWGYNPTVSEVDTYLLLKKSYNAYSSGSISDAKIIAYENSMDTGSTVTVSHFARVSGYTVEAKWGGLERFTNGGTYSPYRTVWGDNSYYGPAVRLYK